jgi:hypothetical protein
MAPKKAEIEEKKKEAQPSTAEWSHSKCSLNHLKNLVSEGLLVTVRVFVMLGIYFVSVKYVFVSIKLRCVM